MFFIECSANNYGAVGLGRGLRVGIEIQRGGATGNAWGSGVGDTRTLRDEENGLVTGVQNYH